MTIIEGNLINLKRWGTKWQKNNNDGGNVIKLKQWGCNMKK